MNFLKSFGALSGASFVSLAANIVRGKLAAVFLGTAGVGAFNQLSLAYNIAGLAGSLASNNGLIRHGAEALGDDDLEAYAALVSTMSLVLAGVSVAVGLAGIVLAPWLSDVLLADGGVHWPAVAMLMAGLPLFVGAALTRGLLGGAQAVRSLVVIQVSSELLGALVFAALVFPFGLMGALAGFLSVHALGFAGGLVALRRRFGTAVIRPRLGRARWVVLRSNLGFGASGFVMVGLNNLALIAVGRVIIGQLGLGAAGLLAGATRLASVYLGAVTATALNHYLPAVTRLRDPREVSAEVSRVLRFYLLLLPPVMAGILAFAPWIVPLILSRSFLPAVPLMLVLVPFELVRILGESLSVPLIARGRLIAHTLLFVLQTAVFVAVAAVLVPRLGLIGAPVGYAAGVTAHAVATFVTVRTSLEIRLDPRCYGSLARAAMLLAAAGAAAWSVGGVTAIAVTVGAGLVWLAFSLRDPAVGDMLRRLRVRRTAPIILDADLGRPL